jgi:hypothetical protein
MVEVHRRVDDILDRLADRLPLEHLAQCRRFSALGEWWLAMDNVIATLLKNKIPVTPSDQDQLRDLLFTFGPPPTGLHYVASPDEVLASLTLTRE